jgi:hypothetical protein
MKNFLFFMSSRPVLGLTQSGTKWILKVLFLGVKLPELEADHSPPISTEVKKSIAYTSIPPSVFMA